MGSKLKNLCRFCGTSTEKSLKIKLKNGFCRKIHRMLKIKIDLDNEDLPRFICKQCCSRTQNIFEFIDIIRGSEENLFLKQEKLESPLEKLNKLKTLRVRSSTRSQTKVEDFEEPTSNHSVPTCNDANLYQKLQSMSKNITIQKVSTESARSQRQKLKIEYEDPTIKEEPLSSDDNDPLDDRLSTSESSDEEDNVPLRKFATKSRKPSPSTSKQPEKKQKVQIITMEAAAIFLCMTCKQKFPSFDTLKDHMQTSDDCKIATLTCETCGKVSKTKKAFYQHNLTHRQKVEIVCEICGRIYTNRFNLENHKSLAHGEVIVEEGIVYKCQICDKQFSNRKVLYEHISAHSKDPISLLCETCGKNFKSQDSLKSHIRSHMDIRNFKCDHCEKRFRSRVGLLQHTHIHTGEKAFKCSHCTREFAKRESLLIHERQHTGQLPYTCVHGDYCRSSFASLSQLKIHLKKVHPNERGPGPTAALANAVQRRIDQESAARPFESEGISAFMTNRLSAMMPAAEGGMQEPVGPYDKY